MKLTKILGSILLGTGIGLFGFLFALQNGLLGHSIRAFTVTSGSMEPTLHVGSVVFTKSTDSINNGDVISFKVNGDKDNIVTHRVLAQQFDEFNNPYYLTAGDSNEEVDRWQVQPSHIIGKEFFTVPYLGYFANFVKTPKGFVALIIVPSAIIVYEELKNVTKEIKRLIKRALPSSDRGDRVKSAVFIPLVAIGVLFTGITNATFTDDESSQSNTLGVSTDYGSPAPEVINLKINEFSPSPTDGIEWVEIYNAGNISVDLNGWKLTDSDNHQKSLSGTIQPNEFYVYKDGNGWLNNSGDSVLLFDSSNIVVDKTEYDNTEHNVTVGRETDGTGNFKPCSTPSPGETNNGSC